jgi:hypothetical protein
MTFKYQGRSSKKFLILDCSVLTRGAKGTYHDFNFGSYSYNISTLTRTAKRTYYVYHSCNQFSWFTLQHPTKKLNNAGPEVDSYKTYESGKSFAML